MSRVLKSTEDVWTSLFRDLGRQYREPRLVLYRDATRTECGVGQSAMGPFYCPADQRVYLDLAFFDDLARRFRAPGQFPQAYVIAHEIGHHVQNLLGISAKTEQMKERMSKRDANALSVRVELQADCFAGVWANRADAARGGKMIDDQRRRAGAGRRLGDRRRPPAAPGAGPGRARQLHPWQQRPAHALVPHRAGERRSAEVRYVQREAALDSSGPRPPAAHRS